MRAILSLAVCLLVVPAIAVADDDLDASQLVREADGLMCPAGGRERTTQEVITDRLAAIAAGNLDLFFCSYDLDAVVLMPGSVITGRAQVRAGFLGLFALLGNTIPTVTSTTYARDVCLLTYTITTSFFSIPDGADTFVVRHGRIQTQTVHATLH